MKRTHYCGSLRASDIGAAASVCGWVVAKRDMGGVIFIDLRDREGVLQTVFDLKNLTQEQFRIAQGLKNQSVVCIDGVMRRRDAQTYNPKIETGEVELEAHGVQLLSAAAPLPFSPEDETVREEMRLKYRYLDLRSTRMQRNLKFRYQVQKAAQEYLDADGFLFVETPILTKSTPEGARDYLVPSRVHHGSFYALPQSPQIFKQLLMVGGIDKYYQVARCFRDEDLRADRQMEFTQVDMEMSFVTQEDVLAHLQRLFAHIFRRTMGFELAEPFERMTWQHAMDTYGSDKPDLRFDMPIVDVTDIAADSRFSVFSRVVASGGVVRAINARGCAGFSRAVIEQLTQKAVALGAKGMAWILIKPDGEINSILPKYFTRDQFDALLARLSAQPGDFILFCADTLEIVRRVLGGLRLELGDLLGLRRPDVFKFLFVTDFPEFEYAPEENRYVAMHHPFTMPYPEDLQYIKTDPAKVRAQAYDVVLNGTELGSGSIRIHQSDVQQKMFEALGFSPEEIEQRFGFMVHAFAYGTPPHGGFAFGLDRLTMLLLGESSLREVIAFPKNKDAVCPMTQAPTPVDDAQLRVLDLHTGQQEPVKKPQLQGIERVALLARIALSQQEKDEMGQRLESVISFADQLAGFSAAPAGSAAQDGACIKNVWRCDEVRPSYAPQELLENAPAKMDGYVCVPHAIR